MRKMGLQKYSLSQIADMKVWGRTTAQKDPLTLFWTGSGIELNMHASELWVEMESDYDTYEIWIDIVINGTLTQRMMLPKGRSNICVYRMMNPREDRNVRIIRDTQAMPDDPRTKLQICSLSTDGTFAEIPEHRIRLEFIGDSITSGEGCTGAVSEQDWISGCFSAVNNYAFMTAHALDAQYHCISQSGWGVCCGWDGNTDHAIPQYYRKICGVLQGEENRSLGAEQNWDFAKWQPDAVIVNLGTNDCGSFDQPDWINPINGEIHTMRRNPDGSMCMEDLENFEEAGYLFLKTLRECNPKSYIIWCYGMLGNELMPSIRKMCDRFTTETGDTKTVVLELPNTEADGFGARSHPGYPSHRRTAVFLTEEIRRFLAL